MTGLVFLAPLRSMLEDAGCAPAFMMFLRGGTNQGKSTISALSLSYFGNSFDVNHMPASYADTVNSIRKKAFWLKDTLLVIDDYHPVSNLQARRRMEDTAQQVVRAFGDLAGRDRQSADGGLAGTPPPRCLGLTSGEDLPTTRESGFARLYTIDLKKGEVHIDDNMSALQSLARRGTMARMMRRYLEWLIPQMDTLPAQLRDRFEQLRSEVSLLGLNHKRSASAIAHLIQGYEMYIKFLTETGILEDPDGELAAEEISQAMLDIVANAETQSEEAVEERPTRMFIDTLRELILTKTVHTLNAATGTGAPDKARSVHIGYDDMRYYYFLPGATYTAVVEQYGKRGEIFPLSERMLWKQLAEDGIIVPDEKGGKNMKNKTICGKVQRVLWIPRRLIDGGDDLEQMQLAPKDDDNPFKDEKGVKHDGEGG